MRKIYIVPNFVTTLGMLAGFFAIISAIHSEFVAAGWAILVAAVFDMLDGRLARLARATSSFGIEYDSLADLVSFGVAPSLLMYFWGLEYFGRLGWLLAFLFVCSGAFRLARFNVGAQVVPKKYFQGLPIPTAAVFFATLVIFQDKTGWPPQAVQKLTSLFLTLGLAVLMVSSVLFPSFKEFNWRSKASFSYLALAVLVLVVVALRPAIALFCVIASYILISLVWNLYILMKPGLSFQSLKENK